MSPPPPSLLRLRAAVAQLTRLPNEQAEAAPGHRPAAPVPAAERSRISSRKSLPLFIIIPAVIGFLLLVTLAWSLSQLRGVDERPLSQSAPNRPQR